MAHLEEKFKGGVLTLTMNRPEARNAMSGEMMQLMDDASPRAADDPEVRCLVLTGTGGAFCSGGDVKGFASGGASSSEWYTHKLHLCMCISLAVAAANCYCNCYLDCFRWCLLHLGVLASWLPFTDRCRDCCCDCFRTAAETAAGAPCCDCCRCDCCCDYCDC